MELFDFINALFNKEKYAAIPDSEKKSKFFMTQRFISIKYPLQAQQFNMNGINQVVVMDFWASWLSNSYNRPPKWLYTKSIKKKKVDKTDKIATALGRIKTTTVDFYLKLRKLDRRDYDFLQTIDPEGLLGELKTLEAAIKEDNLL